MQFQVPQFLDVEDKIIGPFTIKQFLYLTGGVGMGYLAMRFIPFVGMIIALGAVGLGGALGFYKINGKPFIFIIEAGFNYLRSTRLYIWRRREKDDQVTLNLTGFTPEAHHSGGMPIAGAASKLNELTWAMDIEPDNSVEIKKVHSDSPIV
ncbi:MAG: hypothetical protein A2494_03950 [Candidatus Lloydbacteria bacterium RIFOXYC12_FULL_46_25]|uniref:PrgI family protein n=1 Tax=Candidatus Lloydbacteria bacterium RIFOXYC12_FULL_46_25 TaxID=1798670 RepID=A0A1G2DS42_9BACT|nr:MAG: hypothetical protein A2494_03950 [Candidatus Lloydbacteria bacterium RIFOXYC12_FULL_46_25]